MVELENEHIGKRVVYTGRNGNQRMGTIRGFAHGSNMVDVDLDNSTRGVFYVPNDTLVFIPDEV